MSDRNQPTRKHSPPQSLNSRTVHPARMEKLAQARRLLSLRQLDACRQLTQEVLREDPADPIALGLLELSDSAAPGSRTVGSGRGKESPAILRGGKKMWQEPAPSPEPPGPGDPQVLDPLIDPAIQLPIGAYRFPRENLKQYPTPGQNRGNGHSRNRDHEGKDDLRVGGYFTQQGKHG